MYIILDTLILLIGQHSSTQGFTDCFGGYTRPSHEGLAEVICESLRSQGSHETVATRNTVRCELL